MKTYYLTFGSVSPAAYTGLSPTMTIFSVNGVTTVAAPGITETPAGSGLYRFFYGPTISTVFVCDGGATLANSVRYIVGSLDPVQAVDEQLTSVGNSLAVIGASTAAIGSSVLAIGINQDAMGSSLLSLSSTLFALGSSQLSMGSTLFAMGQTLSQIGLDVNAIGSSSGSIASLIGTPSDSFGDSTTDPTTVFGFLKRNQEFEEGNATFSKQTGVWDIYSRGSSVLLVEKTLENGAIQTVKS